MKQVINAVPLVVEGQVSKPIKSQVQVLCPEYPGPQCARVFEEQIENRIKCWDHMFIIPAEGAIKNQGKCKLL